MLPPRNMVLFVVFVSSVTEENVRYHWCVKYLPNILLGKDSDVNCELVKWLTQWSRDGAQLDSVFICTSSSGKTENYTYCQI